MSEDDKNFDFIEIKGQERMKFNHKHFRDPIFDVRIFNIADQLLLGYRGGCWDYMMWKDISFYRLRTEEVQTLRNPFSGEEYEMDANLSGMIMTLYALNLQLERVPTEEGVSQWHHLKDLAYDYAEEIGQFQQCYKMLD